jgi:hypothetical protein
MMLSSTDEQPPDHAKKVRWELDCAFGRLRRKAGFPEDVAAWTQGHVHHWLQWTAIKFPSCVIVDELWDISGKELLSMTK